MTDDSEFDDFDSLDAGAPSGAAKSGHDDHGHPAAGTWFVRFAGRRTGPFDAERLRILVERHLLMTGSARARALLEDWDAALPRFVKVMPRDYRRALLDLKAEQAGGVAVAAE